MSRLRTADVYVASARIRLADIEIDGESTCWVRMPGGTWQPTSRIKMTANSSSAPPAVPGTLTAWDTRPSGTDYVTVESLIIAGDVISTTTEADGRTCFHFGVGKFQALVNRMPAGKWMTFPTGVFEVNETDWNISSGYVPGAVRWPKTSPGAIGFCPPGTYWGDAHPLRTTLRVKANTAPAVNVAGSWFQVGFSDSVQQHWANLHFEGTDQGVQTLANTGIDSGPGNNGYDRKIFTNFLGWNLVDGSTFRDILSTGAYGNNGAPPGESYLFQLYASGGQVLRDV
ncbi:MAG: hypothetical protein WC322_02825, partial [Candidatus Paceibacterota bacterium]